MMSQSWPEAILYAQVLSLGLSALKNCDLDDHEEDEIAQAVLEAWQRLRVEGTTREQVYRYAPFVSRDLSEWPLDRRLSLWQAAWEFSRALANPDGALACLIDVELETHHAEGHKPAAALTRVSDGLPGFGIVAAVLGIVITMGAIGGPPAILGEHVAAALVGTFLGILLAYGFVGPMATALEHQATDEAALFLAIKNTLVASAQGYAPQIAVEFGRKAIGGVDRPSFMELENRVKGK